MAVTAQNSTQYGNLFATSPPTLLRADQWYGKLRVLDFDHLQSGAGDATSTVNLVKFRAGYFTLFSAMSDLRTSAFGASRTLDVGYTAYKTAAGVDVVADPDGFIAAEDVSSAVTAPTWDGAAFTNARAALNSRDGIVAQCDVAGGTIPDSATINGYFVISIE